MTVTSLAPSARLPSTISVLLGVICASIPLTYFPAGLGLPLPPATMTSDELDEEELNVETHILFATVWVSTFAIRTSVPIIGGRQAMKNGDHELDATMILVTRGYRPAGRSMGC
ncbi:hypothetical protein EDB89DRAFT_1409212 [Lactarius sanguifluus]|nr:hypothetical protein EDB89DRAFT_1409212 [Lactarius sanguifluus]